MKATDKEGSRQQPSVCVLDVVVEGTHECGRGGRGARAGGYAKVGGAPSPLPADHRRFGMVWLVVACLTFPTLAFVSGAYRPPLSYLSSVLYQPSQQHRQPPAHGSQGSPFYDEPSDVPRDKYLGGLLAAGFDEQTCLSRSQSTMYRKPSPHRPSPHLLHRLRQYEALHRRCAPYTPAYNRTLPLLNASANGTTTTTTSTASECKYLVWTPYNGLGNNILTMASAFLYSLLTGRVMLVDRGRDLDSLFCEPFPATSWLVPHGFPIDNFYVFERKNVHSYGNILRKESTLNSSIRPLPNFVYAHLTHDYDDQDKRFFYERDQAALAGVTWMVLKSDNYFVPALFLNGAFEPELAKMFPEREAVFHHLGRYLFHPSNAVWGMVTRYYDSYLATARDLLGIQIRVFNKEESPFDVVAEQVVNCTITEKLLPAVMQVGRDADPAVTAHRNWTRRAVLVASLYSQFSDRIRGMYWEHPAAGGTVVSVHQPSHEEWQMTGREGHDLKVWAEMYLLSLSDVLVTSAWSTFGYIAQGLAGVRPWVLVRPYGGKRPEPACVRDVSMEPCFHSPPRFTDTGDYVTHCMDVPGGIKVVEPATHT